MPERSHSSDALTVFEGNLYAGTSDAADVDDWAHVYRYRGGTEWEDCGRLGTAKTRGVYALVVHEKTMTYANVQQITIRQNPLQRALGIATVAVRAAGGGGGEGKDKAGGEAREARFEGVANAEQIRDLIRERVRRHRDAGLGDTDEATHAARDAAPAPTLTAGGRVEPALAAARLLLEEARALRATARWR